MKLVSVLKKRCPSCRFVRRKKKLYVRCDLQPKHKQRQGGFSTLWQAGLATRDLGNLAGYQALVMDAFYSNLIR